jgi:hypothetical protein
LDDGTLRPYPVILAWLLCLTFFQIAMPNELSAASRAAQWQQVDEAINKGLPKTAIELLEPIVAGALKDKAYGEAAKAIARRIVLEGNIQGNKAEEKITRLEAEIARAPKEMTPVLQTILADWYWHYFQNNRWRFMRRTATAEAPGKDFTTWDLPRLFAEIDRQFGLALATADVLKRTPIAGFDELLAKGTVPDSWRPTLYDFIAHEALKFYSSGEQAAAKPEDAFELSADQPAFGIAPVFGNANEFTAGKIERRAGESPVEKAFFLYRDLLLFHRGDKDPSALLDVDLARLAWAYNTAVGAEKTARYQAALKQFVDRWGDHELSALALHSWATVLQSEGNLVEARRLADRGRSVFRDSAGGRMCQNLIASIEAKSSTLQTERVWNAPWPKITLRYRNLTNVWFRLVAYDWNAFLDRRRSRPEYLNDQERRELLTRAAAQSWSAALPPTPDFKERTEEFPAPATLPPGFYFLLSSHNPEFNDTDNQVAFTDVWVSDLALVVRPHDRKLEGFVLQAGSGEPIPGAEVMAWSLNNNGERVPNGPVVTDQNGLFSMAAAEQRSSLLRARAKIGDATQELGSMQEYWSQEQPRPQPHTQTYLFTDRALYRPGQIVQYKGICVRIEQEKDNYEILAGQKVTVTFSDPNGKEIARADHQCNDYGSFTGSFTAPRDRVLGRMQILISSGPAGAAGVAVEEYKRPKFQVTLDAPKVAAKLDAPVSVPGRAESYTGAAVDGALVRYRVVREVRWPAWWGWFSWRSPRPQGSQEIAHGVARTGLDGSFQIEFIAKPDPATSTNDEASFQFTISADVTDSSGETRSAQRSVNVGFTALQAGVTAEEWQAEGRPVQLNLSTSTLDGEPQAAEGTLKVYRLQEPASVTRPPLAGGRRPYGGAEPSAAPVDLSDPNRWPLGEVAAEQRCTTDAAGKAKIEFPLPAGAYRAVFETQDRFGRKVTARYPVQVLQPQAARCPIKVPHLVAAQKWSVEPGEQWLAVWGTGYETGRAFIEIEHRNQMVDRFWTEAGRTQQQITRAVTEAMRGGFTLHITQVRENRAYLTSRHVDVPWSNQQLDLKWEHFTSKLGPGQKETWTAVVTRHPSAAGRDATPERAAAELVATLYDESLDQYLRHDWLQRFGFFYQDYSSRNADFANVTKDFQTLLGQWRQRYSPVDRRYREFPADLVANFGGYQFARMRGAVQMAAAPAAEGLALGAANAQAPMEKSASLKADALADAGGAELKAKRAEPGAGSGAAPSPDLGQVTARRNLNETAFFFPQLLSGAEGEVKVQFTMPEALTQWRFLAFAHDRQLRSGFLDGHAVTAKDLMVQPNPPRFLREGDLLEFTVKVSNQSATRQQGRVRLSFQDARTEQRADALLSNSSPDQAFDLPARASKSFAWRIRVPDGAPFLTYKAVASTGALSDGEEGYVPVLSRRIFVTESLPLPIRGRAGGPVTRKFEFAKLLASGKSRSLVHQNFTVQMVSNPSWYAVLALPYLMEFPHECTEQTFNRFYANALARFIASSDPKIRRVFDQWKGTPALDSPLEKNQDLKSVLVEETPWLRQAENESQARRNVGVLFDANRLDSETQRTLGQLAEMQLPDGSWPWFPGGRGNDFITLYITTGFGRLRHLGADISVEPAIRALGRLDAWMQQRYLDILKGPRPQDYVPSSLDALYLYGRSFFLKERPIAPANRVALEFFLARSREHWLKVDDRQSQGHLALALRRFNASSGLADSTPADIMRSIKERSVANEEMGMFWRETELSWWWYRAPIETQALMIEAFDEVMHDLAAVEDCRVWLLKQKQTQDWKTTKATADAVYALLLRGRDLLASDALVEVSIGGMPLTEPKAEARPKTGAPAAAAVEAGTGFYERRFPAADVKPKFGDITVTKRDEGVAWGSAHWQYFEDMSKVTPHEGTPLKLTKRLFTKTNTKQGPVLEAVKGPVQVGDELVVRIELRVDRDMEYVHLKDQRGSGTEPVNVLSQYKYQDGLAYYETTRDTASHFFIDYLPKGVYVFEYSTRIQHRGQYQTGLAEIQCMYAPEFNSHSASLPLVVN